jgi:putative MATE family efflux protein
MKLQEQDNINAQFYRYLWAYILVALSGCLGTVVDGIIVGNLISEDGVSAINLSTPITQFIFTLHLLINAGAGMLVAYALGQKKTDDARRFFTRSLSLTVGLGLVLSIVGGMIFPQQTARMLCDNEQILPLARNYMQVLLIGCPAFILMWGLSTMVGVDGSPRLVSLAVIIDNAVNLFLDIIFIQWFGWGITGSSAATVVGHLVGIAILLSHWRKPENRRLIPVFSTDGLVATWKRIISQGAPLAVASICLTLLLFSANRIVLSTTGRTGIFVFALCMNLLQVYNLFLSGTCQTLQSLGAIQVGRGDNQGVRTVIKKGFRFISLAMAVTCLLVWIYPQGIARLFGCDEPEMLVQSNQALRVFALSFIPFCYIYVLMIVYKLYSHHHMALFISFALSLTVIPVLWLMARMLPDYLWHSYLIAYVIEAIAIYIMHKSLHLRFELKQ